MWILSLPKYSKHTLDMYTYVQALQVVLADFTYGFGAQLHDMELRGCVKSMPEICTDRS